VLNFRLRSSLARTSRTRCGALSKKISLRVRLGERIPSPGIKYGFSLLEFLAKLS
jgi:hypothetical protein